MSVIRIILRDIRRAYDTCKRNKLIVNEMSGYLQEGVYRNSSSGDSVYLLGTTNLIKDTYSSFRKMHPIARKMTGLIYYLCRHRIKDRNQRSKCFFSGSQIILSSSQKELKVFDYKRQLVLTKYTSFEKFAKYNSYKELFAQSFNVAKTIRIEEQGLIIVEQFISHNKFSVEPVFQMLIPSLIKHAKNSILSCNDKNALFNDKANSFAAYFGKSTFLENQSVLPIILTHGDLWSSNVIFDGKDIFIIDFERAGNRPFLFDFFTFIFTEYLLNKNQLLLNKYFRGDYDAMLKDLFKAVGKDYSINKKESYLLCFLVEYFSERWKEPANKVEWIKDFLNEYIPSYYI